MPVQVEEILGKLREHGYEAFAVGGCVRDAILGRIPGDWDITTSAHPEEVKQVFGHTIDTGLQHGTVTVMRDHIGYEITTYRIDGEYEDGRHPKEVVFTAELREDLRRRDFTINAIQPRNGNCRYFRRGGGSGSAPDPLRRGCGRTVYGRCAPDPACRPLFGPAGIFDREKDLAGAL